MDDGCGTLTWRGISRIAVDIVLSVLLVSSTTVAIIADIKSGQ
jgi:hypothetical protein